LKAATCRKNSKLI